MNFVKLFYYHDYETDTDFGEKGVTEAINTFAKENGCEPISLAECGRSVMVVFQPIDYSNQTGSKG